MIIGINSLGIIPYDPFNGKRNLKSFSNFKEAGKGNFYDKRDEKTGIRTEELKKKIIDLFNSGKNVREICNEVKKDDDYVSVVLRKNGYKPSERKSKRRNNATKEEIYKILEELKESSIKDVSIKYGISRRTLYKWMAKFDSTSIK